MPVFLQVLILKMHLLRITGNGTCLLRSKRRRPIILFLPLHRILMLDTIEEMRAKPFSFIDPYLSDLGTMPVDILTHYSCLGVDADDW